MVQKGLKMHKERQKIEFLDLKYLLFSGISLAEYGGSALLPLTENHPAQNPLAEMGVPPPTSLTEKNPLNSFWRPPFDVRKFRWHWGFSSTSWDRRPAILHSSDLKIRHVCRADDKYGDDDDGDNDDGDDNF